MTIQELDSVKNNPKYQELVRKRSRFAWMLAISMLLVYYAYIMTIAFKPELLAQPLSEDSVITIGIPIGVAIILFAFLITGFYVYRANNYYDKMVAQIKADLEAKDV